MSIFLHLNKYSPCIVAEYSCRFTSAENILYSCIFLLAVTNNFLLIMICLTAVVLPHGGSSIVRIYMQKIDRRTQLICAACGPCRVLGVIPGICLRSKGKSVPLQAWSGPECSRKLRFPDFVTTAQDGGKVVSLTHRPPLPSGNTPGTHFC